MLKNFVNVRFNDPEDEDDNWYESSWDHDTVAISDDED